MLRISHHTVHEACQALHNISERTQLERHISEIFTRHSKNDTWQKHWDIPYGDFSASALGRIGKEIQSLRIDDPTSILANHILTGLQSERFSGGYGYDCSIFDVCQFVLAIGADEPTRYSVALNAARDCGWYVSKRIHQFDLTLEQRFEVAKVVAKHESSWASFESIPQFELTDEQLFEIAQLYANSQADLRSFFAHHEQFKLSKEQLSQVAKQIASRGDHQAILEYFKIDPSGRLDLLKLLAHHPDFYSHLESFHLSQNELYEILQIGAKIDPNRCSAILEAGEFSTIQKRVIRLLIEKKQKELLEIRFNDCKDKLAKEYPPYPEIWAHMTNQENPFSVEQCFELAILLAEKNGKYISQNIKELNVPSELRAKIALVACEQDRECCGLLNHYQLESKDACTFLQSRVYYDWGEICLSEGYIEVDPQDLRRIYKMALGDYFIDHEKISPRRSYSANISDFISDQPLIKELDAQWKDLSCEDRQDLLNLLLEDVPEEEWKTFLFPPSTITQDDFGSKFANAAQMLSFLRLKNFAVSFPGPEYAEVIMDLMKTIAQQPEESRKLLKKQLLALNAGLNLFEAILENRCLRCFMVDHLASSHSTTIERALLPRLDSLSEEELSEIVPVLPPETLKQIAEASISQAIQEELLSQMYQPDQENENRDTWLTLRGNIEGLHERLSAATSEDVGGVLLGHMNWFFDTVPFKSLIAASMHETTREKMADFAKILSNNRQRVITPLLSLPEFHRIVGELSDAGQIGLFKAATAAQKETYLRGMSFILPQPIQNWITRHQALLLQAETSHQNIQLWQVVLSTKHALNHSSDYLRMLATALRSYHCPESLESLIQEKIEPLLKNNDEYAKRVATLEQKLLLSQGPRSEICCLILGEVPRDPVCIEGEPGVYERGALMEALRVRPNRSPATNRKNIQIMPPSEDLLHEIDSWNALHPQEEEEEGGGAPT